MRITTMAHRQRSGGFTLIQVMIVVAIIGFGSCTAVIQQLHRPSAPGRCEDPVAASCAIYAAFLCGQ